MGSSQNIGLIGFGIEYEVTRVGGKGKVVGVKCQSCLLLFQSGRGKGALICVSGMTLKAAWEITGLSVLLFIGNVNNVTYKDVDSLMRNGKISAHPCI